MSYGALLQRCRRGDQRAWREVLDQFQRLVYSIPLNLGLTAEDAADVVQATFMILLQSLDRIEEPERLGSWLATVARRQSIRILERRTRDEARTTENVLVVDDAESHRIVEEVQWVHDAVQQLSGRCQELMIKLYFSEPQPSYDEVAEQLGIPLGSIGPTRARCLEKLRGFLERSQGPTQSGPERNK
jgi:RNA polymerase sigma factor (sigma-70 family)